MIEFLAECKARVAEDLHKCLVVGDINGDFCSTLSSLSLAYYMQNRRYHTDNATVDLYVPIVYTHRDVIDTKTDTLFYLNKLLGINSDDLLCLDDIHLDDFDEIILVDYEVSPVYMTFEDSLVKYVFCKREVELDFIPHPNMEHVFKPAESIATVVAHFIVRNDPQNLTDDDKMSLKILYDCITYRTNNCRACNTYPHDVQMLSELEGYLGVPDESYGATLFQELSIAYEDYSKLDALQLLYKYSAGIVSVGRDRSVYMAYIPIGIKELYSMRQFRAGIAELAEWMGCQVMIIIGQTADGDANNNTSNGDKDFKEYIGVVNFQDSVLYKKILDKFLYDSKLSLCYRGLIPGVFGKWFRNHKPQVPLEEVKSYITNVLNVY